MAYLEEFVYEDPEFYECLYECLIEHRNLLGKQGKWETKDEGVILIKDMTTSHIGNVINMLSRNNHKPKYSRYGVYDKLIEIFCEELNNRR